MVKNIAVCSWSLQPANPGDLIDSINECGLSQTQVALDQFVSGDWDTTSFIDLCEPSGISLCSGMFSTIGEDYSTLESIKMTGGICPDDLWIENLELANNAAIAASQLGIHLVSFHAGFIPHQGTGAYRTIVDRIKQITDVFASHEIELALETGQERAESLLEMLDEPNMSSVGINFDPANMILYGMGDPAKALMLLQERVVQVHMKDAISSKMPGQWGEEVPAGNGQVDWDHFFHTIHKVTQPIDVVIEREAGSKRVEDVIKAVSITDQYGCTR
ncbi:MAG: sugar phosphate isomerase/epimerase [Phycisphaerales bacterium]|nr:sugar phosphate isomerase/epimerase [Phycisphaerales bacterium]